VDDFAADIDAFMDTLGINKATLAGHSIGSLIWRDANLTTNPATLRGN
jgi:pimeloyl-ACP methyl ester carboxylesterase